MKHIFKIFMLLMPAMAAGQFILPGTSKMSIQEGTQFTVSAGGLEIQNGAEFKINDDPDATQDTQLYFAITGNLNNLSTADFSNVKLRLDLNGATQFITGKLFIDELRLNTEGVKTFNDAITVTNKIAFNNGVLLPSTNVKLLFTGPEDGISAEGGSSYYDGIFYSSGSGRRLFPVGVNGLYAPAEFESTAGEVGVQVVAGTSALLIDNVEIVGLNTDRYWQITTDPSQINSRVSLSLNGLTDFDATGGGTTIVQGNQPGGFAENLGTSTGNEKIIVSNGNVTESVLALGKEVSVKLKVHDLITPFGSAGSNDRLFIENLHRFDYNTVTLLDRWGVSVAKWINYTNDINYDFTKLGPGNYICIVEYGKADQPSKIEQQMVTVLKVN